VVDNVIKRAKHLHGKPGSKNVFFDFLKIIINHGIMKETPQEPS
jgi:hypothetical protein